MQLTGGPGALQPLPCPPNRADPCHLNGPQGWHRQRAPYAEAGSRRACRTLSLQVVFVVLYLNRCITLRKNEQHRTRSLHHPQALVAAAAAGVASMQEEEWLEQGGGLLEVPPALAHRSVTLCRASNLAGLHDLSPASHQPCGRALAAGCTWPGSLLCGGSLGVLFSRQGLRGKRPYSLQWF